ncbi:MAG: monovalent cation/H+ antiporter subunit D family protein [Gammaproteobacteria bacterium]|nr:monovalent cation/H+ antiporter subunit D family protein [Gammaproteobacteria bacterium]
MTDASFLQHLSVLVVVVPLLAAPLVSMLPAGRLPWFGSLLTTWTVFALTITLLVTVLASGPISYALGGWAPPWGIEYRIDALNAFLAMLVAGIGAITLPYAWKSVPAEIGQRKLPLFYAAFLLCLTGLLGIVMTGDIFNLFVFLEISSLSTYALVAMGRDRRALTAAYQYLILGTIGATFFLIGVGLLFAQTGTLNMADMAERLQHVEGMRTVYTAFAFIMVGVALKLALFPLHLWLPNAYTYAPNAITVFLASTATKVAVYVMLRMVLTVFSPEFVASSIFADLFLYAGVAGVIGASIYAIYQQNAKRLLAYSSVAQIGYMAMGIGFGSLLGYSATVIHVFNHALMKAALFMGIGAIIYRVGSSRLVDMRGVGRKMPWTMVGIVIGGLSLIGVPGTAGFISKWYLLLAAVEQQHWALAFLVLIGSLLAVIYVWKIVETLFFQDTEEDMHPEVKEAPLALLVPLWIMVLANIWFGFDTEFSADIATTAIELLKGGQ